MTDDNVLGITPAIPESDNFKEIIEKFLSIALPVRVTPLVKVKPIKTECCGKPIITPTKHGNCSIVNDKDNCEFTIVQKMKLEIPVEFKVKTDVSDPFVDCEMKKECD